MTRCREETGRTERGEGHRRGETNGTDSNGAAGLCTAGRSPSAGVKVQGSWWQYSEPALHRSVGGACAHKTDGKPFCVAAPIPGAGAGGGRAKGERGWSSTRWEAAQGGPNAPRQQRRGKPKKQHEGKEDDVESDNTHTNNMCGEGGHQSHRVRTG